MVGPCLMAHGTEEQKAAHLAPIARAEERWAQGFSEPEAGSDLAGLQMRAVRDGDDFVLNGQKIWTSHARKADWLHVLTRTDPEAPKHKGISYFMVPIDSPGLTVRPIESLVENHDFNEVFFDDVRVPAANMIGEENLGWYVATTTLNFERSNIGSSAYLQGIMEDVIAVLRTIGNGRGSPLGSDVVRHRLADLAVGIQVSRTLAYRTAWLQQRGEIIAKESSLGKLYASELFQKFAATVMQLFGLAGQLRHNEPGAPLAGGAENLYLGGLAMTIGGGPRRSSATSSPSAGWDCRDNGGSAGHDAHPEAGSPRLGTSGGGPRPRPEPADRRALLRQAPRPARGRRRQGRAAGPGRSLPGVRPVPGRPSAPGEECPVPSPQPVEARG